MRATLTYNGKTIQVQLNKSTITDDLYVIFTQEETPQYKRLKLDIHPKTDVVLDSLEIELPMTLAATDRVFCNGFQSWSETRIGDWLSIQPSFPNGMKPIADKIHQKGFKAGLWLSPFIVESKSRLFQEKKDWILRGSNGKPLAVGYSPYWSGKFYALDFYNSAVQDYLTGVFYTVLQT